MLVHALLRSIHCGRALKTLNGRTSAAVYFLLDVTSPPRRKVLAKPSELKLRLICRRLKKSVKVALNSSRLAAYELSTCIALTSSFICSTTNYIPHEFAVITYLYSCIIYDFDRCHLVSCDVIGHVTQPLD